MGFVLSKFRKSKPSTKDLLDKIEQDLRKLSRFQYDTELQQKRIIGRLVIGGVFLYLVFLVLAYFFGPRDLSWQQTLGWIIPFILFPVLLITIKRFLGWYFNRKIVKNKEKYESLKKEKQRLLDDVMEKETFNVAKEILEKYAPSHLLPKYLADQQKASPQSFTPVPRAGGGMRRRNVPSTSTPVGGYNNMGGFTPRAIRPYGPSAPGQFLRQPTNNFMRPAIMPGPNTPAITAGPAPPGPGLMIRGPPPPRFMLPPPPANPQFRSRKTGWLDKLVDYVVGDGPANRFALICRYCATHNGLATPEDFPYIGYRCVYCRQFNPPRQQRPSAPTLPRNTVLIEEMESTLKSPENSVNEEGGDDKDTTENNGIKETGNDENNEEETPKDGEEDEERNSEEPVIEMPASSTEDLRRSVESVRMEGEEQSGVDDSQNEEENSLVENLNGTINATEGEEESISKEGDNADNERESQEGADSAENENRDQ